MISLDDKNPKESFKLTFIIQGSNLDFEAISRGMNIMPTHTHRSGDLSKTKKRLPHDMWSVTSPLKASEPLDIHLKWLVNQLKPQYGFIRSLKDSAEVYIYCGYTTEMEQSGFTLSPEALSIFTDLNISMDISILSI